MQYLESRIGPFDTRPQVAPPKPSVIVISGPSGVGKDAVLERLKQLRPDLYFVVTAASRSVFLGSHKNGVTDMLSCGVKFCPGRP